MKRLIKILIMLLVINLCFCKFVFAGTGEYKESSLLYLPINTNSWPQWEIFYGRDTKFYEPNLSHPGIRNTNNIIGWFTNSATFQSRCDLTLRYWKSTDSFDIKMWEYGWYIVKNYSAQVYQCTIRYNGEDFEFNAYGLDDEIIFDNQGDELLKYLMNTGSTFKLYLEKNIYGLVSSYVFEINGMGFKPLYDTLNNGIIPN